MRRFLVVAVLLPTLAVAAPRPDASRSRVERACEQFAGTYSAIAEDRDKGLTTVGAVVVARDLIMKYQLGPARARILLDAVAFAYLNATMTPDEIGRDVFLDCIRANRGGA